ncbi:MAG: Hpt domain-containing protein [Oscillospiraceae bacterium]|nr:Hpt domain-containing protein [Oscillospiraceae bacterium]
MSLQTCYAELGGDFNDVMQRLPYESMVKKFVLKFLDDTSFDDLCTAMKTGDYSKAFMASHTLKGICQNLSFTRLYQSSAKLTEALRDGTPDVMQAKLLTVTVIEDYQITAEAIKKFKNEN